MLKFDLDHEIKVIQGQIYENVLYFLYYAFYVFGMHYQHIGNQIACVSGALLAYKNSVILLS